MFDIFKNRLELTGTLTTVTALRISAGRSSEPIGTDLPVIKDAVGRPLIPGSSFKGAMRSRLESFLRGIDESLAANPAVEAEWAITNERLNGKNGLKEEVEQELQQYPEKERPGKKDSLLTDKIIEETDQVSQVFGSSWLAGKVQIRDLMVQKDAWFGQYQERDGVAIDRDTETAADGKLYDFQVVPANTPFDFRLIVENAEAWELGLLMIGLHQFENEQIPLGGGRSRGLGVVRLVIEQAWWFDSGNKPEQVLSYLQRLVDCDRGTDPLTSKQLQKHKREWTQALISHLSEKVEETRQSATPTTGQ